MTGADLPFHDRRHAGRVLAEKLSRYFGHASLLVLALPRGGAAVGCEVARALQAPRDIFVVGDGRHHAGGGLGCSPAASSPPGGCGTGRP